MEKRIKGAISFLPSQEGTTIIIRDNASRVNFLEITLTNDELASMMSRLANTPCEIKVKGIDVVGKEMEHKMFEFQCNEKENAHWIVEMALERDGLKDWVADKGFQSQNSFFQRDGKNFARTIIRRWV